MSRNLRPPISRLLANPAAALDYEIAQEKVSALGRHGRQLEAALAALRAFDAEGEDPRPREALVAEAACALWNFIVQREACGLRDGNRVMRDYGVPVEVIVRMGVFPPSKRSAGARH